MQKYIPAGKIINTHGVKGEVKADVYLDSDAFLKTFKRIFIDDREYSLVSVGKVKNFAILNIEGIGDINAAMELKGREFAILRDDAKLKNGSYFLMDIIGFTAVSPDGNRIGEITEVFESPAHNILVIKGETEHLVPAIPEFIASTDMEAETVTVKLLEGM